MRQALWVVVFLLSVSYAMARDSEPTITLNKKSQDTNWQELKKISLVSAIIAQCEYNPPSKNTTELKKFSKKYIGFLMESGKYEKKEVLKMVSSILIDIESYYGNEDQIPQKVCIDAMDSVQEMYNNWNNKLTTASLK